MKYKFIDPIKTVKHNGGYLVIESDDGRTNDLTNWVPMMYEKAKKYDKFYPQRLVFGCTNVNTALLNKGFRLTDENLMKLHNLGWEIVAHGRHHAGMGLYPISQSVAAGERVINVMASERIKLYSDTGYEYIISDGENHETIQVESQIGDSHSEGIITTVSPLQFSYPIDAKIQLTDASRVKELQGCIDDLATFGIETNHYVYPYHSGSEKYYNAHAVSEVGVFYRSARGREGHDGLNNINQPDFDMHRLNAKLLNDSLTKETVNTALVQALNDNSVFIIYGHGESSDLKRFEVLEYAIDRALELGIKIISREEAYRILSVS